MSHAGPSTGDDLPTRAARIASLMSIGSLVLRFGVMLSLVAVAAGLLVTFAGEPAYMSSSAALDELVHRDARFPHTLPAVVRGVLNGSGPSIVMAGLLLLVVTPVLRVAILLVVFGYERDRAFAAITAVVLAIVLVSFFVGRAGG